MIALDIEATGVDAHKNSILSIGAVDLDDPTNQFYDECRAWEGAHIHDEALQVNGFSMAEATDPTKKTEAEAVRAFIAWATDRRDWTLLGQNPSFDRDFVLAACGRAHIEFPFAHRTVDTHTLAYMHMVTHGVVPPYDAEKHRTALNLDAVLNYVGIPEEPKPHNALTGALCHAEVASRLLYDRPLLPDFSVFPIPWTVPKKP
ncbi:3'-5' exoribonuclease [Candidatus Kaiserbacteria bacterium]|nr:3'-5' exoribonuclease [Candidatus Kaiserbacteria bacterium]